jgi:hypothetical protein
VTIALPDAGNRFMSMQVIDEDQYSPPAIYEPGPHTLTKEKIGTRYVLAAVLRTRPMWSGLARCKMPSKSSQPGGPGKFEVPAWDIAKKKAPGLTPGGFF